jgi:CRP/FNR family transcriptional regulator, cyclic AMP receptor protein
MRSLDDFLIASGCASAMSASQLQRARATINVRGFQAGNFLCQKGDPSDVWVGVIDGLVKATNLSETGKSVTFATFPANCWFGEGSLLKREARKYDIVALRNSHVALMPAVTFFWLLDTSICFNRFIMNQLNERLGQFMSAFEHDRLDDREARVAHALVNMLHPQLYPGREFRIEISNEELGHLVGVSRPCVNQSLQVLEKSGLIKVGYRRITVIDIDGLRSFGRIAQIRSKEPGGPRTNSACSGVVSRGSGLSRGGASV